MSRIDITSSGTPLSDGMLQTANPLDATLQVVTDNVGNSSTVSLSTTETQINSVLRIRTNNSELLDIENTSGNRFNINRDVQKINLDFSSNPTGSTDIVGAIRTFIDGVNLSDVAQFQENGQVTLTERVKIESDSTVTTQTSSVIQSSTTNANLVIAPNGTGALIADIPDGLATGGNARSTNAVDLQMSRGAADQIARGDYSSILGGGENTTIGTYSIAGGRGNFVTGTYAIGLGYQNNSQNSGTVAFGWQNAASSAYSTVSGGQSNTASTGTHATVVGGQSNTSSGQASVTGGFTNTASGQYSLALGNNNIASGTGAIAIGNNNTSGALDSFSFGKSNNAASPRSYLYGNTNTGSGFDCLAFGTANVVSAGTGIAFGRSNNVSAGFGGIAFGIANSVIGTEAIALGYGAIANASHSICMSESGRTDGVNSVAMGLYSLTYLPYQIAFASGSMTGFGAERGTSQASDLVAFRYPVALASGATTVLSLDGSGVTNLIIPNGNNRAWNVQVNWVAVVTTITGTATGITVGDVITSIDLLAFKKIAGVSSASAHTSTATKTMVTTPAAYAACAIAFTAGASQEMALTFTGPTFLGGGSVTMRVVARIELTEVAF